MSIINYLRLSRTDSDELSVITAKQGDNLGDICQIEVYDNQTIVELSNYDNILFCANKPDKSSILFRLSDGKSNFTKNNNTLNLTLTDTLLAVHGTVKCEISFYKGDEIKSTYDFNIYVFKSPGLYDNLNVSDLSTLKNAVQEVNKAELSAKKSAENAKQSELNASASATASANSASSALSSANIATVKSNEASTSANNAALSANTATEKANNASQSASNASNSANSAKKSETNAKTSENNSKTYANNADKSAKEAESFAHGNGTRENDTIDNAQYYYRQAKSISESLSGALRPRGTVTFTNLPSLTNVSEGDMFNISNEFITTSDFKEGSGLTIPAGSNIYRTSDGKWDILAGSPVTGVKGNVESVYRKGNVNITPDNIGAVAINGDTSNTTVIFSEASNRTNLTNGEKLSVLFGKIKKWFSDLKTVAFSGSYNDLSDKPTIPTVGNGTVTIKQAGTNKGTFTMNQSGNTTIELTDTDTNTWRPLGTTADTACAGNDSRLSNSRPASDVYAWAKASSKPSYTYSEVGAAAASHTHSYLPLSGGTLTSYLFFNQSNRKCDIGFSGGGDNAFIFVNNQNSSGGGFQFRSYDGIGSLSKDGSSWKPVTASSFSQASSIRFKENVQDITEERAKELLKYRVVTYDYKNKDNGTNCMGLIAEEVAEIDSYPVQIKDNEIFGLDYTKFIPQLIKMVQMQQEEINTMQTEINKLKSLIK